MSGQNGAIPSSASSVSEEERSGDGGVEAPSVPQMTIKPMSTTEESAHKRNASATSAVQTTPPPAKRPSVPSSSVTALPPARREFPHAVALVLYRDGGDDVSSTTSVLGAYAGLADANAEARRLAQDQGVKVGDEGAANDINPVRWDAPDGASCWVEMHAVKPKSFLPKTASGGSSPAEQQQPKKLYDADEGEDPDLDDDDQDEGGHYD
ncbi:actin polymerization protein [Colletotrichum incanum]|uniref:Actin polymerization protein n=1 Tax=Colletotrichum incanum TaxID=1573173 RepID=A0A166QUL8_COLIC|nr:actin polymerization protein [Colletotrichum incanum]